MEELMGVSTDDEDFLELVNEVQRRRRVQIFRERENHFTKWNDKEFLDRFRLSKACVRFIVNEIRPIIMSPTDRNRAVTPEQMVLLTLRFYATGSFLQVTGDFIGIHKSTASRAVWKVSRAIAGLNHRFIKMPHTQKELGAISQQFYNISRFPKCVGAVDCTHIRIISPGGDEPEIFRNRKGFFSFNVQAVCDPHCKFENVVCRWPGSAHDAVIFNNSTIRAEFEHGMYQDKLLVGDSGYGLRSYLITPATPAEQLFNEAQIRTRNVIERSFGIWKRRFPTLAFEIRLKKEKVEAVVIATAVLHNIAILHNEPQPEINPEGEDAVNFVNNVQMPSQPQEFRGNRNEIVRRQLIDGYFQRLL